MGPLSFGRIPDFRLYLRGGALQSPAVAPGVDGSIDKSPGFSRRYVVGSRPYEREKPFGEFIATAYVGNILRAIGTDVFKFSLLTKRLQ